jgi:hypothetical protein
VCKTNDPLARCQYFGQNSIFLLDFLGVCRGDILASNFQIWFQNIGKNTKVIAFLQKNSKKRVNQA